MSTAEQLAEFRKFDFDHDSRWQEYLQKVEIPGGREDAMLKVKAKWFKKNINESFNIESVIPSASIPTEPPKPAARPPLKPQTTSSPSGTQPRAGATGAPPRSTAASQELILFALHIVMLLLAVVHLVPIMPRISWQAYTWFLRFAMFTHGFKVYIKKGLPKLNLAALKEYAQAVFPSTDLQYAMIALLFTTAQPLALVLVPFVNVALYHAMACASIHFSAHPLWQRFGAKAHQWLRDRQMNALAEVAVGFMLIAMLLTPSRSILTLYLYWNMLKMRYWSADSSMYHRQVWQILDQKTAWLRAKVPISNQAIGYGVRWFQQVR